MDKTESKTSTIVDLEENIIFEDLPQPRAKHSLCIALGYLFVFGGENNYREPENTYIRLNLKSYIEYQQIPSWELISSPRNYNGIYNGSTTLYQDRYIYYFDTMNFYQIEIYKYDIHGDEWETLNYKTSFDLKRKICGLLFPFNSNTLLLLGKDPNEVSKIKGQNESP